jgi:hypothetical protein
MSHTYIAPICGNPKVDYRGVNEVIGIPNSIDLVSPTISGITISTVGDEGGVDLLISGGVLGLLSTYISGSSICKASSFCEEPSVF